MKINKFLIGIFVCMLIPSQAYSQKWLKKIDKALTKVDKFLGTSDSESSSSNTTYQTTSSDYQSTTDNSYSEIGTVGEVDLRQRPAGAFKVVTNHPDFKIKVKRCMVSGKTCVIDLILENIGDQDVSVDDGWHSAIAYDDEANEYSDIAIALGDVNDLRSDCLPRFNLMAQVPVKARLQIEGVSPAATVFRRLDFTLNVDSWGLNRNKRIRFMNLPITREGDDY